MEYTSSTSSISKSKRIVFIDVLRAYAILMMLQGHFVDTLLAEQYRTASSTVYYLWAFMRGITAPIFFTVTGLVFCYLLLKDGRPMAQNKRVKKGLRRGLYLVGVGYLLKINFPALLVGSISNWVWAIDVLHIIGVALIGLIAVCALREWIGGSLAIWMLGFGTATFMIDPYFTENTWEHLPTFIANYFTRDFGSNFTIVPWLGYAFYGGALGYVLSRRPQLAFSHILPILLLTIGITLTYGSWQMLVNLHELTGWDYLPVLFNNNYLFWRLGHVMVIIALFMWFIPRIGKIPALISKIGGETLTIYGVHYVVLYGTWLGFGLSSLIGYRSMAPIPVAIGAVLFVISHVVLIANIEKVRQVVYVSIPTWCKLQLRYVRVWYRREWPRQWALTRSLGQDAITTLSRWVLVLRRK
ncbi:MAG: heparan-alpha-glucosaminide N-acetyltransferase domain-containing protein [Bacteroidota bacterium]